MVQWDLVLAGTLHGVNISPLVVAATSLSRCINCLSSCFQVQRPDLTSTLVQCITTLFNTTSRDPQWEFPLIRAGSQVSDQSQVPGGPCILAHVKQFRLSHWARAGSPKGGHNADLQPPAACSRLAFSQLGRCEHGIWISTRTSPFNTKIISCLASRSFPSGVAVTLCTSMASALANGNAGETDCAP